MAWRKKKKDVEEIQEEPDESELPDLPPRPLVKSKFQKPTPEKVSKTLVARELPTQPVRKIRLGDGTLAEVVTIEEALEQLNEKIDEILEKLEE